MGGSSPWHPGVWKEQGSAYTHIHTQVHSNSVILFKNSWHTFLVHSQTSLLHLEACRPLLKDVYYSCARLSQLFCARREKKRIYLDFLFGNLQFFEELASVQIITKYPLIIAYFQFYVDCVFLSYRRGDFYFCTYKELNKRLHVTLSLPILGICLL